MATINGTWGEDLLEGTSGDDSIFGSSGSDTIIGSLGNDTLNGGANSDVFGGPYVDVLDYSGFDTGAVIDLGFSQGSAVFAGLFTDTLFSIENVLGTTGNDSITGGVGDNYLFGGLGNDTLGGHYGTDTLDGGYGNDWADFDMQGGDVDLNAANLISIENAFGSFQDDLITGTSGNNYLIGRGGDDTFVGAGGNDTLQGDDGDDWVDYSARYFNMVIDLGAGTAQMGPLYTHTLISIENVLGANGDDLITGSVVDNVLEGGTGDDTFAGSAGNDTLRGGSGNDWLDYSARYLTANVDLAAGSAMFGSLYVQVLESIENVLGSNMNDRIAGTAYANYLDGGAGNDTLVGTAGADTLLGGFGNDRVDYSSLDGGVTLNLLTGIAALTGGATQSLSSLENATGTSGNDSLTGDDAANSLSGGAGDDTLAGLGGQDTLDGGDGDDWIDYSATGSGGDINLASGLATFATWYTEEITNFENAIGSQGDDTISGTRFANRLIGGTGNDSLVGGDGADTLEGGDGNDTLMGGGSALDPRDVLYGGAGDDVLDGGYGNDELRGDEGADTLTGGFGVDTLFGGDGDDVLTGQAWSDLIYGGSGSDFINGGFGFDRINGGYGADRFFHLGVADHGSDWIQDYYQAEGDVLVFGGTATRDQFQVNFAVTVGAGTSWMEEAFVIYRPTGQILWALVDGASQDHINLVLAGTTYDLLA